MWSEIAVRRLAHFLVALAPAYYLLPQNLPYIGIPRGAGLVVFFAVVIAIEAFRLRRGKLVLGMRPHERSQIASFFWACAGICVALWLFPHDIAAAAIVGMAFVDPLAGELRSRNVRVRTNIVASSIAYLAICGTILVLAADRSIPSLLILLPFGTVVAVCSEHFKSRYLDDDFLMLVAPGSLMTALALVL